MEARSRPRALPLDPAKGLPLEPSDQNDARAIVEWAVEEGKTLDIRGGGSKSWLGRPVRTDHVLSLRRLSGIVDYEPAELVLTARAGTPMAEIDALLEASEQTLAFEPPPRTGATVGGVVGCNIAGPRRVRAGAARAHVLGLAALTGRGEAWRAGGKVVKNVTGYDMCKLQTGAFGTLSVLTEISLRVVPRPETACTIMLRDLDDEAAVALMARALNTPHDVSAAAHIPARRVTAIRLEGPAPSVAFRARAIEQMFGRADRLGPDETRQFWLDVGAVRPILPHEDRIVWRLCPTPSEAPATVRRISQRLPSAQAFYDWGGGLVWLSLEPTSDAHASVVRGAMTSGHSMLSCAPEEIRAAVAVFDPLAAPLDALSRRIKAGLDPCGILNPGRMAEGR